MLVSVSCHAFLGSVYIRMLEIMVDVVTLS